MKGTLPDYIEPAVLAESAARLRGVVALAACERLQADHGEQRGDVQVDLQFGIDAEGTRYVRGRLAATVTLTCNRCMGRYPVAIEAAPQLGIVADDDAGNALAPGYEPLLAGPAPLRLVELVEDELLLAIPLVPRHEPEDCQAAVVTDDAAPPERTRKPFAALAALRAQMRRK
ncbi:MAG: DUF177 domain-containing protein [Gammaproteobacteria bacterium]|nr:DUF177 domain-containing protein [Gammaproteobacteria bacterium]